MFHGSTFLSGRKNVIGPAPVPNAGACMALYKRTGLFWQDTGGTIPAVTTGDPVKRWDDSSGNAKHLTWSSGNVPTLRSGGGIVIPVGGAQLEALVSSGGTSTWAMYQTAVDLDTADTGWSMVADNPGTPLTGVGPSYGSSSPPGSKMIYGFNGGYDLTLLADTGASAVRGITYDGTTATAFLNATSFSGVIGSAINFTTIRFGTNGGSFAFRGEIINGAIYSTNDNPTARGLVIAYLGTY